MAYETGLRAVEMVHEDLKPSDILTREAFENAIVACSGDRRLDQCADPYQRDRAPYRRASSTIEDWETVGCDVPLLVEHAAGRRISRRGIFTAPAACPRC